MSEVPLKMSLSFSLSWEIQLFKFIDNLEKEFYVFYAIYLYKWLDKLSTLEFRKYQANKVTNTIVLIKK